MEEEIRKRVEEKLSSEEVKLEIERRIEEGHRKLFEDVEIQLEKEKQAALTEARLKEVSFCWVVIDPLLISTNHYILRLCTSFYFMRSYVKDNMLFTAKYFNS